MQEGNDFWNGRKTGEIQDVLFGLAVAITEPEGKIHNKNEDTSSKQATSNNRLLEVINNSPA